MSVYHTDYEELVVSRAPIYTYKSAIQLVTATLSSSSSTLITSLTSSIYTSDSVPVVLTRAPIEIEET